MIITVVLQMLKWYGTYLYHNLSGMPSVVRWRNRGRRLGDRFCEHLRSVSKKADLPVAKHFSSPGHTTEDMLVAVVRAGLHNTRDRRRAEGVERRAA